MTQDLPGLLRESADECRRGGFFDAADRLLAAAGRLEALRVQRDMLLTACRGMEGLARDVLASEDPSSPRGEAATALLGALALSKGGPS